MTVGDRIRTQRELLGISQAELAQKINVLNQTLYKYEKNIITNIPSNKIEELAKALNVSEMYLMGWEDDTDKEIIKKGSEQAILLKKYNLLIPSYQKVVSVMVDTLLTEQQSQSETKAVKQRKDKN